MVSHHKGQNGIVVLTPLNTKFTLSCKLAKADRRFGDTYCLHFYCRSISLPTSCWFHAWLTLRHCNPPKRLQTSIKIQM
jgi:hypothetical protein